MHMKRIDFENGTITGNILGAALPMLVAQILNLLYNIVDRIYIARIPEIGTAALGAVGLCFPIIVIITAFSNLFGTGGAPLFSIFRGKKDPDTARCIMNTSFTMLCVCAMILMTVGFLFARPILILFGASAEAIVYAYPYMMLYLIGTLPSMIAVGMNPFINAQGYSSIGMLSVAIGAGTNLVLDPLFIFALGLGVRGAAIATVISQCISASLVLRCMVKDTGPLHLDLKKMRLHPQAMRQILRIGLPAGFQGILFSLSNVVIQSSVNTFGEVIMAGNSAAANIEQFVYVSMNAMYQATISFTSQNYGAGNYHRIRKIMIRAQGCVLVVGLVLGNAATLAGRVLLSIYTTSSPVIEAGLVRMGIVCTTYALCGMMDVMVGGLRGIGYSIMPMLVSLVGACGLRLLWIATIFQLPQFHTIQTIYWSYPISWAITFGVHVICFLWAMKKVKRQLLPEGAPAPVEVPPTLEEETVSE